MPPVTQPRRTGPRPLNLIMMNEALTWLNCYGALTQSRPGLPPLKASPKAEALAKNLEGVDRGAFETAVLSLTRERFERFQKGVARYQTAPAFPPPDPPPPIWREGTTSLRAYGPLDGSRTPVLVIPSLINRYTVLDLAARRSLLRELSDDRLAAVVVDWDIPGEEERGFDLNAYVERLERALTALSALSGKPRAAVMGYCMGGLLGLALSIRRPRRVAALALLAAPWDFHADFPVREREQLAVFLNQAEPIMTATGALPVDLQQTMFWARAPLQAGEKFRKFSGLPRTSGKYKDFIRVEDWLNDGVPLAASVARETLRGWYLENKPARGEWRVGGTWVSPARIACPTLIVSPKRDTIVPPGSALALTRQIPGSDLIQVNAGHVGMIFGSAVKRQVYRPLSSWINRHIT